MSEGDADPAPGDPRGGRGVDADSSPNGTPQGPDSTGNGSGTDQGPSDEGEPQGVPDPAEDGWGLKTPDDADEDEEDPYPPEERGSGLIGQHVHVAAHPQDWPYLERGDEKGLDRHPYCESCGLVKYVGPDRPLPGGGIVNLVGHVQDRVEGDGRRLTEAQKRVILGRLRDENADDSWGLDRASQLELFEETVAEVGGFDRSYVHAVMHQVFEEEGRVPG